MNKRKKNVEISVFDISNNISLTKLACIMTKALGAKGYKM